MAENVQGTGKKVGYIGIGGPDWESTLTPSDDGPVSYEDFATVAEEFVYMLKKIYKCDLIIVLAHMVNADDRILANKVPGIDVILGGHDHVYETGMDRETGVLMAKSGTDFEEFSDIQLIFDVETQEEASAIEKSRTEQDSKIYDNVKYYFSHQKKILMVVGQVKITDRFKPDPEITAHVQKYSQTI